MSSPTVPADRQAHSLAASHRHGIASPCYPRPCYEWRVKTWMVGTRRWVAMTLLPLSAGLLLAQAPATDKLPGQPIRDVTVEYKLQVADDPAEPLLERPLKVYWASGGAKMRIEMGDERSYVLLDRDARRMTMVL